MFKYNKFIALINKVWYHIRENIYWREHMKKLISIFAAFILILAGCGNGGNSNEQIENVSDEVLTI